MNKSEVGWIGKGNRDPPQELYKHFRWINFHQEGIKILGIYFSYSYNQNFKRILTNFQTILSIWKTRHLTLYGKIQVSKSLALPKLLYVCSSLNVSEAFVKIIESSIQNFIWNAKKNKN